MTGKYDGIIHLYFFEINGNEIYDLLYHFVLENKFEFFAIDNKNKFFCDLSEYYADIEPDNTKYLICRYICGDEIFLKLLENIGFPNIFNNSDIFPIDRNKIFINKWNMEELSIPTLFKVTELYYEDFDGERTEYSSDIKIKYYKI